MKIFPKFFFPTKFFSDKVYFTFMKVLNKFGPPGKKASYQFFCSDSYKDSDQTIKFSDFRVNLFTKIV